MRRRIRKYSYRYLPATIAVTTAMILFTASPSALADTYNDFHFYHVGAQSNLANYSGIQGTITDPSASSVPAPVLTMTLTIIYFCG